MESLLIYVLKSAGLLSLFYLVYIFLLRNDTLFQRNRFFLLGGIAAALILPALEVTRIVIIENNLAASAFPSVQEEMISPAISRAPDWWQLAGWSYLAVVGILMFRFLLQFISLSRFLRAGTNRKDGRFFLIRTEQDLQPFSFFNYIIYNPHLHSAQELQMILQHEKAHATQWHSVDVLISNIICALLWFNPLSWWYRENLIQNLEYLADRETIAADIPKKEYQKTLIKVSAGEFQPMLANHFYQSFIKKRIMMLNKTSTSKSYWKTGIVLPFLLAFMVCFQARTEAQVVSGDSLTGQGTVHESEFSVTIHKGSTKESLEKFSAFFEKRGIKLDFEEVLYSPEGFITSIKVSFLNTTTNQSGNFVKTDPKGIESFTVYSKENGETGFRTNLASFGNKVPNTAAEAIRELGKTPYFIINGKEYNASDLYGKTIAVSGTINTTAPEEARQQYGEKAKDGIILISEGRIIDHFEAELKKIDEDRAGTERNYVQVEKNSNPVFINLKKTAETNNIISEPKDRRFGDNLPAYQNINSNGSLEKERNFIQNFAEDRQPLFLLNGKEVSYKEVRNIDPNEIAHIDVLKEEVATKEYKEKGSNGVVKITLKSAEEKSGKQEPDKEESEEAHKGITFVADSIEIQMEDIENPGRDSNIKIKGVSGASFNVDPDSPEPLYILDGKVMGKNFIVENLDPEKIESLNVLKGKRATDKYGTKAQKGAIEIITKEGENN